MTASAQPTLPQTKEPSSARLALTLAVAGLVSGLILVMAYEITQPRIEAHRREALKRAVFEVVPGATKLAKLELQDGTLVTAAEKSEGPSVYAAWSDEAFLGWAVSGEGAGFQDTIRLLWGLTPDGSKVQGMQVIDSRETPGLGDRIYKDADFVAEFKALANDPKPEVVANGQGTAPHHVDGITGATISCKAVVNIINAGNETWRSKLPATPAIQAPSGGQP